ncbi:MAG: site-specific DNA-methyltransferase [Clostridia bacterium]|nr:site-specific DNA-methyltransferase [Clostridia bacterium]
MNFEEMDKPSLIKYIEELNEESNGKYGLVWDKEKEPESIVVNCDKLIPILQEMKDKSINKGSQENILIEGDNFHSLSVLNYTHKEKIDIIYIDPPYNTGNQDFMYNDKFVEFEDGYRHSKWLNFMSKRLKLAKDLLKENGLIFVSIGDDEFAQLKLLMDRIFGENNFITNFTWIQTINPPSLGKIRNNMEYVICYSKNKSNDIKLFGRKSNEADSPLANRGNSNTILTIPIDACYFQNEESCEILEGLKKSGVELLDKISVKNSKNMNSFRIKFNSKWGQENLESELKNGTILMVKNKEYFSVRYQKGLIGYVVPDKFLDPSKFDVKDNEYGRKQLESILGKSDFPYPKNTPLIKTLINMYGEDKKNSIILDFFAGSGTTGQAVLELNENDGGNRKFILCTNDENEICQKITYPRLKTFITGERIDKTKFSDGVNFSLKYFKTNFVNNVGTKDQLYYDLTEKCTPMLCVKEDTFVQVERNEEYVIYTNNDKSKYTFVYFDIFGKKYDDFKEKLSQIEEPKALYIFTLGDYVNEEELKRVKNYRIEAIPYRILDLYKKIIKMSKED